MADVWLLHEIDGDNLCVAIAGCFVYMKRGRSVADTVSVAVALLVCAITV